MNHHCLIRNTRGPHSGYSLIAVILFPAMVFAAPTPKKKKAPAEPVAPVAVIEHAIAPSRYAGDNVEDYLRTINALFTATGRVTDPFGLNQDPEAKPVVKRTEQSAPAEVVVPFSEIVPLIRITAVIASEKKFLVQSRAFSQGEEFPLNYKGKQIRILITDISAQQVEFKNLDTGEVAARRLDLLPPGMSAGGADSKPPGMVSSKEDAPLVIEPDESAPAPPAARSPEEEIISFPSR